MATYYVNSGAGGTNSGADWTNAYTAFASAVTAATVDGDVIKVHKTHSETLGADTTYTFAANVNVICVDKDGSDALSTMGESYWIGATTSTFATILAGAKNVFFYGMTFRGGGGDFLRLNGTDNGHFVFESCTFWVSTGSIYFNAQDSQGFTQCTNCTFRFGGTGCTVQIISKTELYNCNISTSGSAPSTLFYNSQQTDPAGGDLLAAGCDFSFIGSSTLVASSTTATTTSRFVNCKLGSAYVALASQPANNNSGATVEIYNCSSGDEHYHFGHYAQLGSTVAVTSHYLSDGAQYDGTNRVSWKIVTGAYTTMYCPYVSPWIDRYHSGISAITPYMECMRDNSSGAVYQNDEVWAEFSYQGVTGTAKAVFVNDRMAILGSPANQDASSKTASDWTGETGTPGFFKIGPTSSFTPAEIGHLRARVCVGEPSITVYVDPTIRGTS